MNFSTETEWNGFNILRWMINYFIDSLNNNTTFIDNKKQRWINKAKPNLFLVPLSSEIRHEWDVWLNTIILRFCVNIIFQMFQSDGVCCVYVSTIIEHCYHQHSLFLNRKLFSWEHRFGLNLLNIRIFIHSLNLCIYYSYCWSPKAYLTNQ